MKNKDCKICGKLSTKLDMNNEPYCNTHISMSNKNEKKQKRITIPDEIYWSIVAKAARNNLEVRNYLLKIFTEETENTFC